MNESSDTSWLSDEPIPETSEPRFIWDGRYERILKEGGHLHLVQELSKLINARFRVRYKVSQITENITINGKPVCIRASKFGKVQLAKNTRLIEGTPTTSGGSVRYPRPHFKEGYAILESVVNGFPCFTQYEHFFKLEILSLEKL